MNIKKGYGTIYKKQNGEKSEMAKIEVKCPYCGKEQVVKYGKSRSGKQKFKCCKDECSRKIFQLEYEKSGFVSDYDQDKLVISIIDENGHPNGNTVIYLDMLQTIALDTDDEQDILLLYRKP